MADGAIGNRDIESPAAIPRPSRGGAARLLRMVDPRLSLAAAIAWSIVGLMLGVATLTGLIAMRTSRAALEREIGQLYAGHAQRLIDTIDANLAGRRQWVAAAGRFIGMAEGEAAARHIPGLLEGLRQSLPEIEWAGFVDVGGTIITATDGVLVGQSVGQRPWFTQAFLGPMISDVHAGLLLDRHLPRLIEGEPRRFVDLSAPVVNAAGDVRGILGVALGWSWIEALRLNAATMLAGRVGVEIFLLGVDGTALLGSEHLSAGGRFDLSRLPADRSYDIDGRYLVGVGRSRGFGEFRGLGWTVIVREPVSSAFAPAWRTSLVLFALVFAGGVIGAALAALAARRLTRRLKSLALAADRLRTGATETLALEPGRDEAGRIGRSLQALVGTLLRANRDLANLNAELDERVAARTREIERLAMQTRRTAVTRERLRISRDLHDTLAHSLLALLTQIRLIRKIARGAPEAVKAELVRAEAAAQEGLTQSREAVTNLRYSPVREDGFGAALERLAAQVRNRAGTRIDVAVDTPAAGLSDERTEAVYRIVEEALRNAEKHAGARCISVTAGIIPSGVLSVRITDDGRGFDPDAVHPGRYGLVGIREQAELIAATLVIRSTPGQGTRLDLTIPPG